MNITLKSKVFLDDGLLGLCWVVLGLSNINHFPKTITVIMSTLAILAMIVSIFSKLLKSDNEDEMSKFNMQKAESNVFRVIKYISGIAFLYIFTHNKLIIDLNVILPIIFGLLFLSSSLLFVFYEKTGK